MQIQVYGKQGCSKCASAKKKIGVLLDRWGAEDRVEIQFMDMEADEHAAAEGDFFDVFEIPSVLVMGEDERMIARWDGQAPPGAELQPLVCGDEGEHVAA